MTQLKKELAGTFVHLYFARVYICRCGWIFPRRAADIAYSIDYHTSTILTAAKRRTIYNWSTEVSRARMRCPRTTVSRESWRRRAARASESQPADLIELARSCMHMQHLHACGHCWLCHSLIFWILMAVCNDGSSREQGLVCPITVTVGSSCMTVVTDQCKANDNVTCMSHEHDPCDFLWVQQLIYKYTPSRSYFKQYSQASTHKANSPPLHDDQSCVL